MSLLENLDQETLKKIVTNAMAAGVIDKNTLDPVNPQSYEMIVGDHGAFEIPPECDRVQYLSEGGYGVVTRCRALNPARYGGYSQLAVKKVSLPHEKAFDSEWEDNIRLLREIHFMRHLPHPNITPIVHIYMNKEAKVDLQKLRCFYIVMPLYSPGSLDVMGVISDEKKFCGIVRDVTSGLLWMHKHKVLHRDIKRENIFYDEENNNAVIADLGMARSTKKKMTGGRECSTKSYLAPELIMETSESYSFPVDIWALGCVFYEMLIFADEGGAMFAESNPYHLILARQYSINKTFGTKLGRKRIRYGTHNIQELASQEGNWVKNRWLNLEKQMTHFVEDKNWDPSMGNFIPEVIKKCLQFYPNDRCTAQELADMFTKSHVCKTVGDISMPKKKIKQAEVTENFLEKAEKLKTDKQRGDMIRQELWRLVEEAQNSWAPETSMDDIVRTGLLASSSVGSSLDEPLTKKAKRDPAKDLLAKDMARDRELTGGSSSSADVPMLLTDDSSNNRRASSSGANGTPKAKVTTPKSKALTSMRKPSAAAKRRNTRKALALPTIDEEICAGESGAEPSGPPKRRSTKKAQMEQAEKVSITSAASSSAAPNANKRISKKASTDSDTDMRSDDLRSVTSGLKNLEVGGDSQGARSSPRANSKAKPTNEAPGLVKRNSSKKAASIQESPIARSKSKPTSVMKTARKDAEESDDGPAKKKKKV